jgi:hypothetical protein
MKMKGFKILTLLFVIPLLASCATSAGGHKASEMVSAQLTLVAEEGKRFSQQRDSLAKARLRVMHELENSTLDAEQEIDMDRMAWKVVGATFRTTLYDSTLEATEKEEKRMTLQEQRRAGQEKALADVRSTVRFKQEELVAAAKKLSLLSKVQSAGENRKRLIKFVEETAKKIETEAAVGGNKANAGITLLDKAEEKLKNDNLKDKALPTLEK